MFYSEYNPDADTNFWVVLIRCGFVVTLTTAGLLYLHHKKMKLEFENKLQKAGGMELVDKVMGEEMSIKPKGGAGKTENKEEKESEMIEESNEEKPIEPLPPIPEMPAPSLANVGFLNNNIQTPIGQQSKTNNNGAKVVINVT